MGQERTWEVRKIDHGHDGTFLVQPNIAWSKDLILTRWQKFRQAFISIRILVFMVSTHNPHYPCLGSLISLVRIFNYVCILPGAKPHVPDRFTGVFHSLLSLNRIRRMIVFTEKTPRILSRHNHSTQIPPMVLVTCQCNPKMERGLKDTNRRTILLRPVFCRSWAVNHSA